MKKKTTTSELTPSKSEILLYTTRDGKKRIEVRLENPCGSRKS
ncbi:MAG: hypothetical protein OIN89_05145 [Candidatus Methanoperedens sp.]|nr:hypothetical protein [Candidatus Methanoperedens sp.]